MNQQTAATAGVVREKAIPREIVRLQSEMSSLRNLIADFTAHLEEAGLLAPDQPGSANTDAPCEPKVHTEFSQTLANIRRTCEDGFDILRSVLSRLEV